MRLAGVFAAVLVAAIAVATLAYVRSLVVSRPAPYTGPVAHAVESPAPSPYVPPSPIPRPQTLTWDANLVDASTGWLLLARCTEPSPGECQYSVGGTANGGQTWSLPVNVGPTFASNDGSGPRNVHFLTPKDGFAWGYGAAFATHDGGMTWADAGLSAVFIDAIVGRGTRAWSATYPCPKGTTCQYQVRSSTDAGRTWGAAYSLPGGFSPQDLTPFGKSGLLVSSIPAGDMEVTPDGGVTWKFVKTNCTGNPFHSHTATPDGKELWELCVGMLNGTLADKVLFVSEDAGKTWSQRASSQAGTLPQTGVIVSLVSNRAQTAFMASDSTPISVTHDGGLTWAEVAPPPSVMPLASVAFIRFASATDGWAMSWSKYFIWATSDGGQSWSQLPAYIRPN